MNDANDQQRLSVAKWALFLFIFGLLAPFVLILLVLAFSPAKRPWDAVDQAAPFAVALGVIAEVLALILGLVGTRHVAGKIAWIGSTVSLGLALAAGRFMFISGPGDTSGPNPSGISRVYDEGPRALLRTDPAEDKGPPGVQASHVALVRSPPSGPPAPGGDA